MRVVILGMAAAVLTLGGCASSDGPTSQLQIKDDVVRPKTRTMHAAPGPSDERGMTPALSQVAEGTASG